MGGTLTSIYLIEMNDLRTRIFRRILFSEREISESSKKEESLYLGKLKNRSFGLEELIGLNFRLKISSRVMMKL